MELCETFIPGWVVPEFGPQTNPTSRFKHIQSNICQNGLNRDVVIGYMESLSYTPTRRKFGGHRLVQDIEWTISKNPQQRERFTSRTSEIFSELALVQTAIQEIFLFEPLYGYFDDTNILRDDESVAERVIDTLTSVSFVRDLMLKENFSEMFRSLPQLRDEYQHYVAQPGSIQVGLACPFLSQHSYTTLPAYPDVLEFDR
jgi:hypothetical protein